MLIRGFLIRVIRVYNCVELLETSIIYFNYNSAVGDILIIFF